MVLVRKAKIPGIILGIVTRTNKTLEEITTTS